MEGDERSNPCEDQALDCVKLNLRRSQVMFELLKFIDPKQRARMQFVCRRFYYDFIPRVLDTIPIRNAKFDNFLATVPTGCDSHNIDDWKNMVQGLQNLTV